jgi:ribosomal protein L37AE/L43A
MKPWHKKEWREMRDQRIGDRCEQCDSTDGPFVLQHFEHDYSELPSKNPVVWELMREYDKVPPRPTVQRPACPQCNRRALSERKKLKPKWRCIGCHHEFDEPIIVETTINNRTEKAAWVKWKKEILFPARDNFLVTHHDIVEQRYGTVLSAYKKERQTSDAKYMSGEETATFCKKCAFLWDMKEMQLCSKCRKQYHPFKFQTCYDCLPEIKKEETRQAQKWVREHEEFVDSIDELYESSSNIDTSEV